MDFSIVEYFSGHSGYHCGYCNGEDTSYSHGMWTHSLKVEDYQALIDRGWRRSGKYAYKPSMNVTCCPQYTIRCQMRDFKLSKSHKKVLKQVHRYLNTGQKPGSVKTDERGAEPCEQTSNVTQAIATAADVTLKGKEVQGSLPDDPKQQAPGDISVSGQSSCDDLGQRLTGQSESSCDKKPSENELKQCTTRSKPQQGSGADPNKPQCKKAKLLRQQKWLDKHKGQALQKNPSSAEKTLSDFLKEISDNPKHKLEIRLVRSEPKSREFQRTFEETYRLYKKYQMVVHDDPPDKPTERQFTRFLVDSPLKEEECGFEAGLGSFHQQYWLDGQLVAVGVIDILPKCVSSVYLYYDPDYSFLGLGTYSALRELEFSQRVNQSEPGIEYYYMGYYIHSCPKMKYKGQYYPSFLLCPETYTWHPIAACSTKLDANKFSRFDEAGKVDDDGDVDIDECLVLHQRQALPYVVYRSLPDYDDDTEDVKEYASFVGGPCARRMLLYRA